MRFTRSQQLGILILCVVIIALQILLFSDGLFQKTSLSLKDNNELSATTFIADQTPSPKNAYWTTFLNQDTPIFWGTELIAKKLNYVPNLFAKGFRAHKTNIKLPRSIPICKLVCWFAPSDQVY